jgi:hypothetical protein
MAVPQNRKPTISVFGFNRSSCLLRFSPFQILILTAQLPGPIVQASHANKQRNLLVLVGARPCREESPRGSSSVLAPAGLPLAERRLWPLIR